MKYTKSDVMQLVKENDVKFVKLAFCDIFGTIKNISIMSSELDRAFDNGVFFNGSHIKGYDVPNLLLFPDPATFSILPWRPQQGRVVRFYCDVKDNKRQLYADPRMLLKSIDFKQEKLGLEVKIAADLEFYLFNTDENGVATNTPFDNAGLFDAAPLDKGENIRREICLTLEQMGIMPISSHHERGSGQNVIKVAISQASAAADNITTYKSVVKTIAARSGLYASFEPQPMQEEIGNGMKIGIYLYKDGINVFAGENFDNYTEAQQFCSGILSHAKETSLFTNPVLSSYDRLKSAGYKKLALSRQNDEILNVVDNGLNSRLEIKYPDSSSNPYIVLNLLVSAGFDGVANKLKLSEIKGELPPTLKEAVELARSSNFAKGILTDKLINTFIDIKF